MNFLPSKITISIVNKFKRQLIINQHLSAKDVDIKGGKTFYSKIFFGLKSSKCVTSKLCKYNKNTTPFFIKISLDLFKDKISF